jgi:hypothetical protein
VGGSAMVSRFSWGESSRGTRGLGRGEVGTGRGVPLSERSRSTSESPAGVSASGGDMTIPADAVRAARQ